MDETHFLIFELQNTNVSSQSYLLPTKILKRHEWGKKLQYNNNIIHIENLHPISIIRMA